jgi:hypothetical protein
MSRLVNPFGVSQRKNRKKIANIVYMNDILDIYIVVIAHSNILGALLGIYQVCLYCRWISLIQERKGDKKKQVILASIKKP